MATRSDLIKRIRAMQLWRRGQREDYRTVFGGANRTDPQCAVIQDLRGFCFAEKRTAVSVNGAVDTHAMALAEGRREVWLRISRFLSLSDEQLERIEKMELQQRRNVERAADEENYAA